MYVAKVKLGDGLLNVSSSGSNLNIFILFYVSVCRHFPDHAENNKQRQLLYAL